MVVFVASNDERGDGQPAEWAGQRIQGGAFRLHAAQRQCGADGIVAAQRGGEGLPATGILVLVLHARGSAGIGRAISGAAQGLELIG
ncbi:hypothetical protein D3C86_1348110 [compost metagenome]